MKCLRSELITSFFFLYNKRTAGDFLSTASAGVQESDVLVTYSWFCRVQSSAVFTHKGLQVKLYNAFDSLWPGEMQVSMPQSDSDAEHNPRPLGPCAKLCQPGGFQWLWTNEWNAVVRVSLRLESRSRKALEKQCLFCGSLCFQLVFFSLLSKRLYNIHVTWFDWYLSRKGDSTALQYIIIHVFIAAGQIKKNETKMNEWMMHLYSALLYIAIHPKHRWRGERVKEPIKWMGIIRRPWLTRASGGEFGQDTGVTPLLFTRSAMGFIMTTDSQDLGLMSHPKDGACWQYSVPITTLGC